MEATRRRPGPLDRAILHFDRVLRAAAGGGPAAARPYPAAGVEDGTLTPAERRRSGRLMRVNHTGEVAAQALYHGQSLTARRAGVQAALEQAAGEENDHLAWCLARLRELDDRPSRLGPLWYLGSLGIGAAAGAAGDRWSLGFLAETERQVVRHLEGHLQRLPGGDHRSRAVIEQMREDEARHATTAVAAGGARLPGPVRGLMRLASRVMTATASRI